MISTVHYISQGATAKEQMLHIREVLDKGADWVQLRWKKATEQEFLVLSESVKALCDSYRATFIINDSLAAAKAVDADGVHLGLDDASIALAKATLGEGKIIGGTANTLAHVRQRIAEGCDYIGVGPYRFTETKEKLSPILGLEGYQQLLSSLRETNTSFPPIIAIGGIRLEDIQALQKSGIYGVALSGVLTQNPSIITQIQDFYHETITNS